MAAINSHRRGYRPNMDDYGFTPIHARGHMNQALSQGGYSVSRNKLSGYSVTMMPCKADSVRYSSPKGGVDARFSLPPLYRNNALISPFYLSEIRRKLDEDGNMKAPMMLFNPASICNPMEGTPFLYRYEFIPELDGRSNTAFGIRKYVRQKITLNTNPNAPGLSYGSGYSYNYRDVQVLNIGEKHGGNIKSRQARLKWFAGMWRAKK